MQNDKYTEYDLKTGAILRVASCSKATLPPMGKGEGRILKAANLKTDRVVNGEIVPRHKFEVTTSRTANDITLSNVPTGTLITTQYEQFTMDDTGVFELALDQPVSISVTLSHPHYVKEVYELEA